MPPDNQFATPLNDSQQRVILYSLLDLHRRLAEMESLLVQSQKASPLDQYVGDLSPIEMKVVRDYFDRLRARMRACLEDAGIVPEVRRTGLRWVLQVHLTALHVVVAEMNPKTLSGYGQMSESGRDVTVKVQEDITRLIDRISAYLRQGLGHDLSERLNRLEAAPADRTTLIALDQVITRRGLVEFRPQLDMLVRRLEAPQFEIAVFGRVSSGKSSLLNHLAGMDVLPVGVTPITAVPTRLVRGDKASALVSFAEVSPRVVPVEELRDYASEEGNPDNHKHVTGILVHLPAPRLREGVVLVDTPGIGSLALSGSAETFAYLPRCDLGVVLIDAASTLTPNDLGLLRLLYEAGVPAQVVLSKVDLLSAADRERTAVYIRQQVKGELGLELAVHPVSTVGADESLLTHWFEQKIEPMLSCNRALAEASVRRKIAHLRESVIAVLQTLRDRDNGPGPSGIAPASSPAIRLQLDKADAAIRQARNRVRDWSDDRRGLLEIILEDAAQGIVSGSTGSGDATASVAAAAHRVLGQRDKEAHGLVVDLHKTLVSTLEELRQSAQQASVDAASLRDGNFRGMPAAELPPLRFSAGRPWWAFVWPRFAVQFTLRKLRRQIGPLLREQVELHDRQLRAWLNSSLAQLVELYEAQVELFREELRRERTEGEKDSAGVDLAGLEADLRELQAALPDMRGAAGRTDSASEGKDQ